MRIPIEDKKQWVNEVLKITKRKNELLPIAENYKIENQKHQFEEIIKGE